MKNTKSKPDTGNSLLDIYFCDISKYKNFSYEQEKNLAIRIAKGDKKAEEELILGNLRFVINVVSVYQHQGLPLEDLINIGNIGLIKAAKKFDYKKGYKFISYAVWWIRQQVLEALANQSRIARIPINRVPIFDQYKKAIIKLQQELRREPEPSEIMAELNIDSYSEYQWLHSMYTPYISIDSPIGEGNATVKDTLEDQDTITANEFLHAETTQKLVTELLQVLSEREKEICRLHFGLYDRHCYNLQEIGDKLNLTRERVRQIKERAIRKLFHHATVRKMKTQLVEF